MASKAHEITNHRFHPTESLLLDANVWMSIYGPHKPRDRRTNIYSQALKDMLAAGCRLHIDVLIASEFVNRFARLKWKQIAPSTKDYKLFRQSPEFKPVAREIANSLNRIIAHCQRIESGFATVNIAALIAEFSAATADFNDQLIAAVCERDGLTLVTHDADFKSTNLNILTANRNLLS